MAARQTHDVQKPSGMPKPFLRRRSIRRGTRPRIRRLSSRLSRLIRAGRPAATSGPTADDEKAAGPDFARAGDGEEQREIRFER